MPRKQQQTNENRDADSIIHFLLPRHEKLIRLAFYYVIQKYLLSYQIERNVFEPKPFHIFVSFPQNLSHWSLQPWTISNFKLSVHMSLSQSQNSEILKKKTVVGNLKDEQLFARTCLPPSMLSSSSKVRVQGCSASQIFSK